MQSKPRLTVHCSRCGREATTEDRGHVTELPRDWEGSPSSAVCAGCQFAEWHPHCIWCHRRLPERVAHALPGELRVGLFVPFGPGEESG
jgi:hypothetical protein